MECEICVRAPTDNAVAHAPFLQHHHHHRQHHHRHHQHHRDHPYHHHHNHHPTFVVLESWWVGVRGNNDHFTQCFSIFCLREGVEYLENIFYNIFYIFFLLLWSARAGGWE